MNERQTDNFDMLVAMKTAALCNKGTIQGMIAGIADDESILLDELTDSLCCVNNYIHSLDHAIARGFPRARPDHRG